MNRSLHWVAEEFDRRAASYDSSTMHRWQAEQAADLLDAKPGQRILDLATGTGLAIRVLTDRCEPSTYLIGIDVSEQMLRVAVQKSDRLRCSYARADAHHLPFQPRTFDAFFCVAAVAYFQDLHQVIQEWRRVSRPTATVVFTTPAAGGLTVNRILHAAASNHGLNLPDPHAALGSEAAIRTFARPLGLSIDQVNQLRFPEPLDNDPQAAFNAVINYYGYAGVLHDLPQPTRKRIFEDYQRAHLTAARNAEGGQDWLFIRGHL